jgi:hypothetical protein
MNTGVGKGGLTVVANNLKSVEVSISEWERRGAQGCSQQSQVLGGEYTGMGKGGGGSGL